MLAHPSTNKASLRHNSVGLSAHQKKRSYIECLENYVQYLHQQLRLIGHEPAAPELVHPGTLTLRSMQTVMAYLDKKLTNFRNRELMLEKELESRTMESYVHHP